MSEENKPSHANLLKQYFDKVSNERYGVPQESIITPFGIKTLDTILGGGISSSLPVAFSSAPETGKSTLAFQFAANFLKHNDNSTVFYIDVEGASSISSDSSFIQSRIQSFGIDPDKISYYPAPLDISGVFNLIKDIIAGKKALEEKQGIKLNLLIVWDSIAATPSSKDINAEDPNEVIGFKARELTHLMSKLKIELLMNQVTMIVIDQVRANMKIQSRFQTPDDKGVGEFSTNYKSATNVSSFQHAVRQWVYISKGSDVRLNDGYGIDGYVLNVVLEKNKLAPSRIQIPILFDKKYGAVPILSEYFFMSEFTKYEKKVYKDAGLKKIYQPVVETSGQSKIIKLINPETGEIEGESDKFKARQLLKTYHSDESFKKLFDKAVDYSIQARIIEPFFNRSQD
jgi:RecA/RadA recombinase